MSDPSQTLAGRALGVPADADPAAARRAFLAHLVAADFVPSEASLAAVRRLGGATPPLTPDAADILARYESADVEAFLAAYWSLDPDARRGRWAELADRTNDPDVRARLASVQAGLWVPVVAHADEFANEVAGLIRECYVLAPRPRAIRRMEWCAAQPAGAELSPAGRLVVRDDPKLAALDPPLLDYLLSRETPQTAVKAMSDDERAELAHAEERKAMNELRREAKRQPSKSQGGGWFSGSFPGGWLAFIVVLALLRGCAALVRDDSPTRSSAPPVIPPSYYNLPDKAPQFRLQDMEFTPEEVRAFEAHDPTNGLPAPPRYTTWMLLGRPGAEKGKAAKLPLNARFTPEEVQAFRDYKPGSGAPYPPGYSMWVFAGMPDANLPSRSTKRRP